MVKCYQFIFFTSCKIKSLENALTIDICFDQICVLVLTSQIPILEQQAGMPTGLSQIRGIFSRDNLLHCGIRGVVLISESPGCLHKVSSEISRALLWVDHWTMQISEHAIGVQPAGLVMSVMVSSVSQWLDILGAILIG